jgi:hypothetical protein
VRLEKEGGNDWSKHFSGHIDTALNLYLPGTPSLLSFGIYAYTKENRSCETLFLLLVVLVVVVLLPVLAPACERPGTGLESGVVSSVFRGRISNKRIRHDHFRPSRLRA